MKNESKMCLSTEDFTWHGPSGVFVAEASDLPRGTTRAEAITLLNPKSGGICTFKSRQVIRDGEHDIIVFRWTSETRFSGKTLNIDILND